MSVSIRQNKFKKYEFMNESRKLSEHLPDTEKLEHRTLMDYLEKYRDIILKPLGGKRGRGVIRVTKVYRDEFEIHFEKKKEKVEGN